MAESCVEHLALAVSSCHPKARTLLRLDLAHHALQCTIDRLQSAMTGHKPSLVNHKLKPLKRSLVIAFSGARDGCKRGATW